MLLQFTEKINTLKKEISSKTAQKATVDGWLAAPDFSSLAAEQDYNTAVANYNAAVDAENAAKTEKEKKQRLHLRQRLIRQRLNMTALRLRAAQHRRRWIRQRQYII